MKTGLKIIYVIIAFIVCFFAYYISYSEYSYTYVKGIVDTAIANKDYAETAKLFGSCFDKTNLVSSSDDYVNVAIFKGVHTSQYSYTENETTKEVDKFELSYYIYIFAGDTYTIDYSNWTDTSNTYNHSGIRFYSEGYMSNTYGSYYKGVDGNYYESIDSKFYNAEYTENSNTYSSTYCYIKTSDSVYQKIESEEKYSEKYYDYYFVMSSDVNSNLYVESPTSYDEAVLYSSRDYIGTSSYYSLFGMINFTFDQCMLDAIGFDSVTKIEILDTLSNAKRTIDITLDFDDTEGFYKDIKPLANEYNEYFELYNSDPSSEDLEAKQTEVEEFQDSFQTSFLTLNENYTFRYDDDYFDTTSITWKTIGTVALFIVCAILIYFLLFHFRFIKGIFNRNSKGYDRYSTASGKRAGTIITAKTDNGKNNKKAETKNETAESVINSDAKENIDVVETKDKEENINNSSETIDSSNIEDKIVDDNVENKENSDATELNDSNNDIKDNTIADENNSVEEKNINNDDSEA